PEPGYIAPVAAAGVMVQFVELPTVALPVPEPELVKYAIAAPAMTSAATTLSTTNARFFVNLRNMELASWLYDERGASAPCRGRTNAVEEKNLCPLRGSCPGELTGAI